MSFKKTNYHTHTPYCDGKNTAEEMVLTAIERGFSELGFSGHSYVPFDLGYAMDKEDYPAYRAEIEALKEKYKNKIKILCGIELDYFSDAPTERFDYVLGSVHYVCKNGEYVSLDRTAAEISDGADRLYGGDIYSLVEDYYSLLGDVVDKTGADIVGHFDILTKFHEQTPLFDTNHPRYLAAWQAAADKLLTKNVIFEINTGAIARGRRTFPYPNEDILLYLAERGARFCINSDCHYAEKIDFWFDKAAELAEKYNLKIVTL